MKAGSWGMEGLLRAGRAPGKKEPMDERVARDFEATYQAGSAPWDIGRPQGAVVALEEAGQIVGSVLDIGCGTGENALYLASRGHPVFGLDASETAIARARQKAVERGLPVQFHVWDAFQLGRLRKSFDTVIDCGLFHVFSDAERRTYVKSVAEVAPSGSNLFVLCFSDEEPPGPGPRRVSQHELPESVRGIFALMEVTASRLEHRLGPDGAKAWLARFTKI
jgi:SAM-dependent methyltransferase